MLRTKRLYRIPFGRLGKYLPKSRPHINEGIGDRGSIIKGYSKAITGVPSSKSPPKLDPGDDSWTRKNFVTLGIG